MLRRTASALMIVIACCGISAAADLELLPKGHPKARPAERPVQTQPAVPSVPTPPTPTPQTPARQTPSQQAPVQQPSAPQRLQSPETPGDQGKAAPSAPIPVPSPVPGDDKLKDLQPPALPAPTGAESWWQKVVRNAPHCRTFSDGCRTCDATFTCSSMPIACQPKEFVCTDPASPPSASPPSANPSPAIPPSK